MWRTPHTDRNRAIHAYREFDADRIVAEVNNGGDLVEDMLRLTFVQPSPAPAVALLLESST
jgi:phage terminase large subunit-like protein